MTKPLKLKGWRTKQNNHQHKLEPHEPLRCYYTCVQNSVPFDGQAYAYHPGDVHTTQNDDQPGLGRGEGQDLKDKNRNIS